MNNGTFGGIGSPVGSMSQLKKGIQLAFARGCTSSPDRIRLHTVERVSGEPYTKGAFVPSLDERIPSPSEEEVLLTDRPPTFGAHEVVILDLSPVLSSFRKAASELEVGETRIYGTTLRKRVGWQALDDLSDYLVALTGADEVVVSDIKRVISGRRSTTRGIKGELLGLHLDDNGLFPEGHRRVIINLGDEARRLLMVNIPAPQLLELMGTSDEEGVPGDLAPRFLAAFPSYPIVSVQLLPGEGYVMSTRLVLHDGSSVGQKGDDYTMLVSCQGIVD